MPDEELGSYIWRGGKKISLEKTPNTFTAILTKSSDVENLRSKAKSVEVLHSNIVELTVDADERDRLMNEIRSQDRLVSHHQYTAKDSPSTKYSLTDEIIAKFKPELSEQEILELIQHEGLVIRKKYDSDALLLKVTSAANANPIKVANRLMNSGKVVYAEPNLVTEFAREYTPIDPLFREQWHLSATPDSDIAANADVSAPEAWDLTRGRREVIIAVLDDGFDLDHPDFRGDGKIVSPKDYIDGDIRPFPTSEHDDYHGTPCAGVAIAEENGIGCTGVAPGCAFMPVRFDLNVSDDESIGIFEFISRNADVVSCSWGVYPGNSPLNTEVFDKIHKIATTGGKRGKGLVIVVAAGNYDAPLNLTVGEPIRYRRGNIIYGVSGPIIRGFSIHPDVICVAACTSLNEKSAYSNWGKEISVAAPSNNFHPITREPLVGRGITTTDNEIHGTGFTENSEYTSQFGGTSSATPLVAGVAGLVISANPNLTAKEVKEILQSTADKIIDPGEDPILRTRKGTYGGNGHSEWFGYGKVNAYRAVVEALRRKNGGTTSVIQRNVAPNMDIPDHDPAGVRSTLMITESGKIEDIKVSVNITHEYIGDLIVTLISPYGETAMLHRKTGANTPDISKIYDTGNTESLRSLLMKEVHGVWTLAVADMDLRDVGKLVSWGLEIRSITSGNVVRQEIEPEVTVIPDNNPAGIRSSIRIDSDKKIKDIKVWVDITHSYIGDLIIDLVSPASSSVRLHDNEGRSDDNIVRTYTPQDTPQLRQILGESAGGEWVLKVADIAVQDEGYLNRWGVEITLESPLPSVPPETEVPESGEYY